MLDDDWHRVCTVADLGDEDVVQHQVGDMALAVYNVAGEFYATADSCTHHGASLAEGYVAGELVECPLHQGQFHIPTGQVRGGPPCEDLPVYPVQAVDGWLFVQYVEDFE